MNSQQAVIAAEAREEIAFWPLAAGGYLYVQTESLLVFTIILLTIVPAAGSYLALKQLREIVTSRLNQSTGWNRTNPREDSDQIERIVDELEDAGLKSSTLLFGLNGIFGIVLYVKLSHRIFVAGSPDLIAMGLFLIPLVPIGVAVTPLFR
ncbi:hypothetical protein [Halorubrum sp. C191]|uniref:hypothetical protein n=1 Tax=Halorubrum sp. C191 TaxID=1383842 RepID=UPI001181B0AE|nr:hypothetical protein [Halorubrum sp. C191]